MFREVGYCVMLLFPMNIRILQDIYRVWNKSVLT